VSQFPKSPDRLAVALSRVRVYHRGMNWTPATIALMAISKLNALAATIGHQWLIVGGCLFGTMAVLIAKRS